MAYSQIKAGALISYANVGVSAVLGLFYTPWLIHTIGSDSYSLYTLAFSVITFFMMDFGLGSAITRFMSVSYAQDNPEKANRVFNLIFKWYLFIDCLLAVVLIVVFLFIDTLYSNLGPDQLPIFKSVYIILAVFSIVNFPLGTIPGALASNERFVTLSLCSLLQKIIMPTAAIVVLLTGHDVVALILSNCLVSFVFHIVRIIAVRRQTDIRLKYERGNRELVKEIVNFSIWEFLVSICYRLIFTIMPSIIAMVSSSWEVALFGLVTSLEGYVGSIANALNGLFLPKVSRVIESDDATERLQQLASRVGRIQVAVIGGIVIGFAAFGIRFVDAWIGSEYTLLYPCTLLLILPMLVEVPLAIANTAVTAVAAVRSRALVYLVMLLFNVAIGAVVSSTFGCLGACASICAIYIIRTLGMCVIYRRRLKLSILRFAKETYVSWLLPAILSLAAALLVSHFLLLGGWAGLAVGLAIYVLIYALLVYFMSFNAYERDLFLSVVKRVAHRPGGGSR